jgi:hypothetical protein
MKILLVSCLAFFTLGASGQIGIGTSSPNASAKLEIASTSKGFLLPRVALNSTSDVATIASPATALLVYNTATAGNVTPGFYFYSGTAWVRLVTPTDNVANVTGTVALANGGTGATTASAALTSLGAAPLASPTFTGTVTTSTISNSGSITAKNYVITVPSATTAAATTSINLSTGNIFKINLGANITTLSLSNALVGTYILEFIQGGTYTVTFPTTNWKWSGGSAPTITATSGKTDIVTIVYDGTTYFASAVQNF